MADKKDKKLQEMRSTTVGELLDMRDKLDKAFEKKLGKKPESGFNIYFGAHMGDSMSFEGGYPDFDHGTNAVTYSYNIFETPQEAFEYTMQCIQDYEVPTKEDKIKALEEQLKRLKEGGTKDKNHE